MDLTAVSVGCHLLFTTCTCLSVFSDHLIGLVVKASASGAEDPEFNSRLRHGDFSRSSHTGDLKIGTPLATLSGTLRDRVSSGTGWPSVSIL